MKMLTNMYVQDAISRVEHVNDPFEAVVHIEEHAYDKDRCVVMTDEAWLEFADNYRWYATDEDIVDSMSELSDVQKHECRIDIGLDALINSGHRFFKVDGVDVVVRQHGSDDEEGAE